MDGLDRLLSGEEWARVIYHVCKHRGFWFTRKSEAEGAEGGKVKQGLDRTLALMKAKNYRTAAEMMLTEFPHNQRNKRGDYSQSLNRDVLSNELATLFEHQRALGNAYTSVMLEHAILNMKTGLLWQQKPALSGQAMLNLIGKCTFERDEFRAPKHSYSAERFVWLTKLNNLRVSLDGEIRPLTDAERTAVIDLPYELASVKYKQLKAKLIKSGYLPEETRFVGLNYRDGKDPEDEKLMALKAWHALRKALEGKQLATEWKNIATRPDLLDQIAVVLSVYKSDDEIHQQLNHLQLPASVVDALLSVSFSDFIRLSLKALKALTGILPHMERGLRYDQACDQAGYIHSKPAYHNEHNEHDEHDEHVKQRLLPSFYVGRDANGKMLFDPEQDLPTNPVVLRSINQARIVVNALVRKYGAPMTVHIEMARDLSRPFDERQKIEKDQKTFRERNEQDRTRFEETFGRRATGREFEKWQLYHEQDAKCAYSIAAIDLNRLISDLTYTEIDHALPYSRSFDDSKNNKVLALTKENRDKGNQTPYEYLGGASDSPRWQHYVAYVNGNKKYRQAKRDRLLRKQFGKEDAAGFKARNLQDTRYACRYFKNFIEHHLALHTDSDAKRCVVVSGQLTSFLRARWGLAKQRDASDRHHAIDATVVAACSHSMVKRLSDYARRKELQAVREGFVDMDTGEIINADMLDQLERHFPRPWAHFENELCIRAGIDRSTGAVLDSLTPTQLREHLVALGYAEDVATQTKPLFVSRAPKRRNSGAAHKDTIYAAAATPEKPERVTQKVALNQLSNTDLAKLVEPHRNEALYEAIHERMQTYGGKADKAFAADKPLYKPTRDGSQGPLVRSVTIAIDKLSGIPIRGGIAKNDSMLRVDVFRSKDGKLHLVPLYVHHRVARKLPNLAIVATKHEEEWTVIDESFEFCFSVYPNDFIRISVKGKSPVEGYYAGCDRTNATISVWRHDRNQALGKKGLIRSIGVKMALNVEKFHVDELGNIFPAKPEVRRGLA